MAGRDPGQVPEPSCGQAVKPFVFLVVTPHLVDQTGSDDVGQMADRPHQPVVVKGIHDHQLGLRRFLEETAQLLHFGKRRLRRGSQNVISVLKQQGMGRLHTGTVGTCHRVSADVCHSVLSERLGPANQFSLGAAHVRNDAPGRKGLPFQAGQQLGNRSHGNRQKNELRILHRLFQIAAPIVDDTGGDGPVQGLLGVIITGDVTGRPLLQAKGQRTADQADSQYRRLHG